MSKRKIKNNKEQNNTEKNNKAENPGARLRASGDRHWGGVYVDMWKKKIRKGKKKTWRMSSRNWQ